MQEMQKIIDFVLEYTSSPIIGSEPNHNGKHSFALSAITLSISNERKQNFQRFWVTIISWTISIAAQNLRFVCIISH